MSTWVYTLPDGTEGTVEAEDLWSARVLVPPGYLTLKLAEDEEELPLLLPRAQSPDGTWWELTVTNTGASKWKKIPDPNL